MLARGLLARKPGPGEQASCVVWRSSGRESDGLTLLPLPRAGEGAGTGVPKAALSGVRRGPGAGAAGARRALAVLKSPPPPHRHAPGVAQSPGRPVFRRLITVSSISSWQCSNPPVPQGPIVHDSQSADAAGNMKRHSASGRNNLQDQLGAECSRRNSSGPTAARGPGGLPLGGLGNTKALAGRLVICSNEFQSTHSLNDVTRNATGTARGLCA